MSRREAVLESLAATARGREDGGFLEVGVDGFGADGELSEDVSFPQKCSSPFSTLGRGCMSELDSPLCPSQHHQHLLTSQHLPSSSITIPFARVHLT